MSLATIIKKIEDEAEAHGQKLIAEAQAEGEQVVAHGREEADKEAAQIVRHAEEELQSIKSRQMATTLLRLRKEKLDNRQQVLDKVFSQALDRILAYEADRYKAMLRNILLSVEEEQQGSIILSGADKPIITQDVIDDINAELKTRDRKLQFTLARKTADIEKGFIVDFKDFEMNYSVEKILSGLWEEIKGEVSKRLFEG
jgi:V/A-type H+-transporting ATPase subunit E